MVLTNPDRDCRSTLLQINGVSYKFKEGVSHTTNKRFIGYIAQQIESVVPEAVQLIDGTLKSAPFQMLTRNFQEFFT